MRNKESGYAVFQYNDTKNLGDAIQTAALSRLLPGRLRGVDRTSGVGPAEARWVINGWLGNNRIPPPETGEPTIFAGVYVSGEHNLEWLGRSPAPIGARDPSTFELLQKAGIPAEMTGCATLTFPRYRGPRSGSYVVDVDDSAAPRSATTMTHDIPWDMTWRDQWTLALQTLELYRRAKIVYTSRLHVALPCLAFGTPVVFSFPEPHRVYDDQVRDRLSLLPYLGVSEGAAAEPNVADIAARFRAFLGKHLDIEIKGHAPRFPH